MKPTIFLPKIFVLGLSTLAMLAWQRPAFAFGPSKPHKLSSKYGTAWGIRAKATAPKEAAVVPRKSVASGNAVRSASQINANTGAQDDGSSSSTSNVGQAPNQTPPAGTQINNGQPTNSNGNAALQPADNSIQTNPIRSAAINPTGKTAGAGLAPAPPLGEWEKYVIQVTQKYQFTEDQYSRAKSILHDLKQRAQQYGLTRAPDFEQLNRMMDQKARLEAQKKLNLPIDTLFAELKMRLENLPTLEQKHRADAKTPAPRTSQR